MFDSNSLCIKLCIEVIVYLEWNQTIESSNKINEPLLTSVF